MKVWALPWPESESASGKYFIVLLRILMWEEFSRDAGGEITNHILGPKMPLSVQRDSRNKILDNYWMLEMRKPQHQSVIE